jgi:phosphoglycerate dehydrogenase-like enzyme
MTTARTITAWLPEPGWVEAMGGLPEPMTADVWTGGEELPDSAVEVEVVVVPFGVPGSRLTLLGKLPRLRLVQLMSAGAERVIPHVPAGVTLCNARGVHDPAVAEWIMAVTLAQLQSLPITPKRSTRALGRPWSASRWPARRR